MVSKRYERGSIILASNKTFGEWATISTDTVIVLSFSWIEELHHSVSFNIRTRATGQRKRRRNSGQRNEDMIYIRCV
ncbi:ATP-binding protein [bacterium]|nr:ATP-binding protein [bacterium]MBU1614023.1 ATP-binding protein [bacterium]